MFRLTVRNHANEIVYLKQDIWPEINHTLDVLIGINYALERGDKLKFIMENYPDEANKYEIGEKEDVTYWFRPINEWAGDIDFNV
jgi:hypothetical protein